MTTADELTIASAQYPIDRPASLAEWERKVASWVEAGARAGASLLVFPEYAAIEQAAFAGPGVADDLDATLAAVADLAESRVAFHAALARRHGVHLLVGSGPTRDAHGRFTNAAQLVTPDGRVGVQEKLLTTPFERDWGVVPGDTVRVFETAIGTLAIAICYDSEFPLLVRAMVEAGADVLLVPSCTERISGYHRVRTACLARALENGIVTVQSPTVGEARWSPAVDVNRGAAGIYVPAEDGLSDDGVLATGTIDVAGWVTATVDRARLVRVREAGEMRNRADWSRQPGAPGAPVAVERVVLV